MCVKIYFKAFFFSSLTNPHFRFQPMVSDCPSWGLVTIPALIPFSPSGPKTTWRPDWKVVPCIWFENPNIVLNIGIAECRWSKSSDSQYVGDPSSTPRDEPHRYRTKKTKKMLNVVGFGKVCHQCFPQVLTFLWDYGGWNLDPLEGFGVMLP